MAYKGTFKFTSLSSELKELEVVGYCCKPVGSYPVYSWFRCNGGQETSFNPQYLVVCFTSKHPLIHYYNHAHPFGYSPNTSTRKALVIEVLATCTQDKDVVAKTITIFG